MSTYITEQPIAVSGREICKKGSRTRSLRYKGLQELYASANKNCLELVYISFQNRHISLASRWRREDFELWRSVDTLKQVNQTSILLFFGVRYLVISWLWKQFPNSQTVVRRSAVGRPTVTTHVEVGYIAVVAKRPPTCDIHCCSVHWLDDICIILWKLQVNGMYGLGPRVCVLLSIHSKEARLNSVGQVPLIPHVY